MRRVCFNFKKNKKTTTRSKSKNLCKNLVGFIKRCVSLLSKQTKQKRKKVIVYKLSFNIKLLKILQISY